MKTAIVGLCTSLSLALVIGTAQAKLGDQAKYEVGHCTVVEPQAPDPNSGQNPPDDSQMLVNVCARGGLVIATTKTYGWSWQNGQRQINFADTTGAEIQVTEDIDNRADWLHHNIRNPQDWSVTFVDVISRSPGRALVLANLVPSGTSQGPVAAVWVVRQAWNYNQTIGTGATVQNRSNLVTTEFSNGGDTYDFVIQGIETADRFVEEGGRLFVEGTDQDGNFARVQMTNPAS